MYKSTDQISDRQNSVMQPQSYEPEVFMAQVLIKPEQNAAVQIHRELGPFEHLLWLVDQWTPRNFALVSRIEGSPVSVESLGAALLQVQHRHPNSQDCDSSEWRWKREFTSSPAPICLQVVRRVNNTQWLHEVERQLALPFEHGDRPRLRAVLVQGDAVSELTLIVHHSMGDGLSAMHLVRDLLKFMEGHKLEKLPPRAALEDLLCSDSMAPMTEQQRPDTTSNGVARTDRPQRASLQIFQIEPDELDRISSRCRQRKHDLVGGFTFRASPLIT